MAVSINKYGYAVDDNGNTIGVAKRADGETADHYLARAQARVDSPNGTPIAPTENWKAGGNWAPASSINAKPVIPQLDIMAEIEKLRKAQTQAAIAGLGKARDQSLSNLSAEKATIEPKYQQEKMKTKVNAQQSARSFDEYMAQRGGNRSGIAAQGQLMNNLGYQGAMGELSTGEANAIADNARRVTDVGNAYNSDVAAAEAGAMATALQNTINQMNQDRAFQQAQDQFAKQFGLQEAGVTGTYNGSPTMAAQQAALQKAIQEAQLLGKYNGQSTLPMLQYQTGVDQFNRQFESNNAQQAFENKLAEQQLALSRQNAARSSSGSSSTNLSALKYQNELGSQQAFATAMTGLQNMASDGASRSEILKFINSNAGDLQANGVPVQDLYKWASTNFTWDKDSNGEWYDTAAK